MPKIDQYSAVPIPLRLLANDAEISVATGFFRKYEEKIYLVTNWHVLSGRYPHNGQPMHKSGAVPDKVNMCVHLKDRVGAYNTKASIALNDQSGQPAWFQHPREGQNVDVAALELAVIPSRVAIYDAVCPDEVADMSACVGMDVFVLGYPLGLTHQGILPVWKRASIASEPELPAAGLSMFLVDTATRQGMSGAPVILRTWGYVPHDDGTIGMGTGSFTRFLGIYSGRYGADDEFSAQLGRVWRRSLIDEVVRGKCRGSYEIRS